GFGGQPSFRTLLQRTKQSVLAAYDNQDAPFERVLDALDDVQDPARFPVFQALLLMHRLPTFGEELADLAIVAEQLDPVKTNVDLVLELTRVVGKIKGRIAYAADLFTPSYVETLIGDFKSLLALLVDTPDAAILRQAVRGPPVTVLPSAPVEPFR